jgi:filamentous hemagglutinin family protein
MSVVQCRGFAAVALSVCVCGSAIAGPNGGSVVGGSATILGQGSGSVTINQSSQSAIINWATFNIGKGETTTFNQPNSASVALNRVIGGQGPSFLDGTLTANGRVFIVNGDGILFGPNSSITTAGFLATTHNIRNEDFMAGKYNFNIPGNPSASIVNQGSITATSGGFAALVAPGVRNSGTITATLGTVSLAAGNAFTLDFYGDRLITLAVNDRIAAVVKDVQTGETLRSLVHNTGKLSANGGRVELTAAAARAVVDSISNNKGVIEANSIGTRNGMIVLGAATGASKPKGAQTQTVKLSGTISAAGKDKGSKGGTVVVTGENIALVGATIDASGDAGGGKVLIGGDTGGGHPSTAAAAIELAKLETFVIPSATTVSVDATSVINASATGQGNGGKVVLWSDQKTTFAGTILAQGGATSGNGGFVETSSHGTLGFSGMADLNAPQGRHGTLLLDPLNATIDINPGSQVITVASIQSALATGDVIVSTNVAGSDAGDIIVAAPVSWTSANRLTLSADNNIAIHAAITGINGGLALSAGGGLSFPIATITAIAPIAVGTFTLQAGAWTQVTPNLPAFSAADFRIAGGSFLRALGGGGLSGSPYRITDIYGLQGIGSSSAQLSASYVLANNIDAGVTVGWNGRVGFSPIGKFGSPFLGVLDGQGHTIDKFAFNLSTLGDIGLFGHIGPGGLVENVGLTNVSINVDIGNGTGGIEAGALAGNSSGTISHSYASGSINVIGSTAGGTYVGGLVGLSDGTVFDSYAAVSVVGTGSVVSVGGLVGANFGGSIAQSYATGSVSGSSVEGDFGGLVGSNSGRIMRSFATGGVTVNLIFNASYATAGGLVGTNSGLGGQIVDSYATGPVSSSSASVSTAGLVGWNAFNGTISQSYAIGTVRGAARVGGLVGQSTWSTSAQSYWDAQATGQLHSPGSPDSAGLGTSVFISGLPAGFDGAVWAIKVGQSYPYFSWQPASTIPHPISNPNPNPEPPPPPPPPCVSCPTPNPTPQPPIVVLPNTTPQTGVIGNLIAPPIDRNMANSTPPVVFIPSSITTPSTPSTQSQLNVLAATLAQQYASQFANPIVASYADANGYISPKGTPIDLQQECAVLVQAVGPSVKTTNMWTAGDVVGSGNTTLSTGTPIATFKDGKYPSDGIMDPNISGLAKFSHAAIFIDYIKNSNNKIIGMYVLDQYEGKPAGISYKAFPGRYQYSVIN